LETSTNKGYLISDKQSKENRQRFPESEMFVEKLQEVIKEVNNIEICSASVKQKEKVVVL
jgi:hypothetical protein